MVSERIQRQIDRLLDEADEAARLLQWEIVRDRGQAALAFDQANKDAQQYLATAQRELERHDPQTRGSPASVPPTPGRDEPDTSSLIPHSFVGGRYQVKRALGEGGKKRVYAAHDTMLDRDVAFALIKSDGLDAEGRERITREAQAMGRLGTHPQIVTVFDAGVEGGSPLPLGEGQGEGIPYLVTELMGGGDVEGLLEKAPDHKLPIEDAVNLAIQVTQGLEFAHAHGLIHRDLKPGNVWLAGPGMRDEERAMSPTPASSLMPHTSYLAKIGDFGLAVSLDRSRLTVAGMMVGTVAYMPPEQATGGAISPRSDLYSLGAMLYELVTGRPPFVGDDSVAIIGQHLNTPPVSPTWHRPDLPAGLEALILRLLEKDPAKRPETATQVREALEVAAAGATSAQSVKSVDPSPGGVDNPLYRRTFVGRETELRQFQATFDAAMSGQGALVMVVGEPGIGKTALCEQLATYAAVRGGRALVGHCYEEGSLSLPYLPFVEAIRSYVLTSEPEALKSELGSGAADVARIVSEIREKVQVEPRGSGDPEDDRWRLYQAITAFLRNAGAAQPLLLVLEDLHWADRGTMDFLVHLSRNLQGARIVLAGTYRDVEVDRTHPLSGTIAELRRGTNFARIPLRGLTVDEVHRMMCQLRGQEVPWGRAEAIHRQTEGNPLFIQEVLRYLVEEGLVVREGGRWTRADDGAADSGIPEGLRDVIGKRLSRLSPDCNRLLTMAAVIGREFDLGTLLHLASTSSVILREQGVGTGVGSGPKNLEGGLEEEILSSLEEALRVGVLEERSQGSAVRYRFTHAFFQQTLYEEIIAPRRIRLHQQVARALEQVYGRRLEEHAAELAEHYAYSSDPSDLQKAVRYGEMASGRAASVYAYSEAVRYLERCLQVQEVLDPDDHRKRCALLLALAEVLLPAGEPQRAALEVGEEALRIAESLIAAGSSDREAHQWAALACRTAIIALNRYGGAGMFVTPEFARWVERALRHAPPNTVDRVYAEVTALLKGGFSGNRPEGWRVLNECLDLARRLADPEALHYVASYYLNVTAPAYREDRLKAAREVATWSRQGVSAYQVGRVLYFSGNALLSNGYRQEAEVHWGELRQVAERARDVALQLRPPFLDTILATIDGRFEDAVASGERLQDRAAEVGSPEYARQWRGILVFRPLFYLGREEEAGEPLAQSRGDRTVITGLKSLCLAQAGRLDEGQAELASRLSSLPSDLGETPILEWLVRLLEAAVALGDRDAAMRLLPHVRPMAGILGNGEQALTCVARHLGAASALLGEPEEARAYYDQALELCGRVRFRPETALTRLQLAELLLEHYPEEHAQALQHLDFAIAEFRDMKMQPSLERALKHKGLLNA